MHALHAGADQHNSVTGQNDSPAPQADNLPRLLTVREAAHRLALGRSTLYNLMDRGSLPYVKIGRARRIPPEALECLIRESLIVRDSGAFPA
ncbi:MAG: helix-turn-helix domain-containing protein [Planctomycetaceae bacterium]